MQVHIGSCLVLNETGQLLLLKRHIDVPGGGQWGFPGGRVEINETSMVAAIRELQEETGIIAPKVTPLGSHTIVMPHDTVQLASFKLTVLDNTVITLHDTEHQAFHWFAIEALLSEPDILYGIPTILHDFGMLDEFITDPTLADGSQIRLDAKF